MPSVDGAARRKRHQTYPELVRDRRCRLVVVGVEVGGRLALRPLPGSGTGAHAGGCARRVGCPVVRAARSRCAARHRCVLAGVPTRWHEVLADVRWQLSGDWQPPGAPLGPWLERLGRTS